MKSHISRNIRELRIMSGMTSEEMAEKAGISKSLASMIELGRRNVTLESAIKIAGALDTSVDLLARESSCGHVELVRFGFDENNLLAKCISCGKEFAITERS